MKSLLLFLILVPFMLFSLQDEKESWVNTGRDVGFFGVFQPVIYGLHWYERGYMDGYKVDFGKKGLYYDESRGPNWWEYYFEPINLGHQGDYLYSNGLDFQIWLDDPIYESHKMIRKYIKLKPEVKEKIDEFFIQNLAYKFVIGVHYRGTDKKNEVGRVPHEKMIQTVKDIILMLDVSRYKIFVATDEQEFLNKMINEFHGKVCFIDAFRSTNEHDAIHYNLNRNPYQCGLEALMDCILLSRTQFLIHTKSNLSDTSRWFNPSLECFCVIN